MTISRCSLKADIIKQVFLSLTLTEQVLVDQADGWANGWVEGVVSEVNLTVEYQGWLVHGIPRPFNDLKKDINQDWIGQHDSAVKQLKEKLE